MLHNPPTSQTGQPANRVSRRTFLRVTAGSGLVLGLRLPVGEAAAAAGADSFAPNAFIRIGSDGQVILTMPYVEMGQGTYTSISMLIAEELEIDLKQVQVEHAPPNEKLYANPLTGQAVGRAGQGQRNGRLWDRCSPGRREDRDPCTISRVRRPSEERG